MSMFDEELAGMVNYTDETIPAEMPTMERPAAQKPVSQKFDPVEAQYIPFRKAERGFLDRLRGCAVWSCICGSISMLLWWFQVNDLMAMEASYPCILVCTLLAGFGVGKNIKK